jgi:hypothetical protein
MKSGDISSSGGSNNALSRGKGSENPKSEQPSSGVTPKTVLLVRAKSYDSYTHLAASPYTEVRVKSAIA